jgi:signal transduction histidine kinase
MAMLAQWLNVAVDVAFVLLALFTLTDWLRHRDRQRIFLVLALLTLTVLVLVGPLTSISQLPPPFVFDLIVIDFLLSGYFLLLFRDSLVPLGTRPRAIITAIVAVVAVIVIAADLSTNTQGPRTTFQLFAIGLLIVTWVMCVAEPIFRLGLASIGRPAVEGARLRALSLGYVGLIGVVVVGTIAGAQGQSASFAVGTDLVALIIVPILYASFSPPAWLRRVWAYPEQDEMRRALHELLLFSADRGTLAAKALEWGTRLVGAAAGFIVDSDGTILAVRGITIEAARKMSKSERPRGPQPTTTIPLDLAEGSGWLTIISGPFTPVFGGYEISLLRGYAVSITAGLDRVLLTQRIAALEKAKTEFLNLASHELRAPMTVIKGYLTMLAAGSLGEMPPKTEKIIPMLVAKSDEVTSMLEQMIEASRLEEGRMALKKQHADIVRLTEEAIDGIQPLIADGRLIDFDRPPATVWSDVDPDRYQMVVRNLISNAMKYSPSGSDVTVRLVPDGTIANLEVTDHGVGIAKEDQERLFTRFGRIENKSTKHTAGTGLGLWLSREIARMHDGDLRVDSEVGQGSTFTLEIPIDSTDRNRT